MEKLIKEIYKEVEKRCMLPSNYYGIGAWDHHIKLVYEIVINIHRKYGADYETVVLAALLHDVASITNKDYTKNHHIIGAKMAEDLLKGSSLKKEKLELIKQCILNHRGSVLNIKKSPEEVCVADADAMAHFYSIPALLRMVYVEKGMTIDEGVTFVWNKFERSYNKLSPLGKEEIIPHYEASKILLKR